MLHAVTDDRLFVWLQRRSEEGGSTDTASTSKSKQDSGVGRTDDSVKADESSEQVSHRRPPACQFTLTVQLGD